MCAVLSVSLRSWHVAHVTRIRIRTMQVLSSDEETLAFSLWFPQFLLAARLVNRWIMSDAEFEVRQNHSCTS